MWAPFCIFPHPALRCNEQLWQGVGALNASTAFNVPDQPRLGPSLTSSAHILGHLFKPRLEPSALLQAMLLKVYVSLVSLPVLWLNLTLLSLLCVQPASRCCTWQEFLDRSPPKWRSSPAFSGLGLLIPLYTRSATLFGSYRTVPCKWGLPESPLPRLWGSSGVTQASSRCPQRVVGTEGLVWVEWLWGVMCDQQQETGMLKLSVGLSKSWTIQISLNSPLKLCGCRG